jgi:hypothetical protein
MNATTKKRLKTISIFTTGVIIGAFICYAFMWYQVYGKLNAVWTCQIFVGQLSIEEDKFCAKYHEQKANNDLKYY